MHDKRNGGDLSHVDFETTGLNEQLFGAVGWERTLRREITDATKHKLEAHIDALSAKSRKKEASLREKQGLVDPWQRCRKGPLREAIITVNKSWFGGTGHAAWDPEQVAQFRENALAFLREHFPNGQLRFARGHADEETADACRPICRASPFISSSIITHCIKMNIQNATLCRAFDTTGIFLSWVS